MKTGGGDMGAPTGPAPSESKLVWSPVGRGEGTPLRSTKLTGCSETPPPRSHDARAVTSPEE